MSWDRVLLLAAGICLLMLVVVLLRARRRPRGLTRHTWNRSLLSWGGVYRQSLAWHIAHPQRLRVPRGMDLLTLARTQQERQGDLRRRSG